MTLSSFFTPAEHAVDRTRERIFLALLLACGVGLRLWHIGWDLPEIYEKASPFRAAWRIWNWGRAGFDFDPHIYPALSVYVHFILQSAYFVIGHLLGVFTSLDSFRQAFEKDPTNFLIIARLGTVVFDAGTMAMTYQLGKLVFGRGTGFLAAGFVAVNVVHIKEAHLVSADPLLAFFMLLAQYFIIKILLQGERKCYMFAGLAIGLAASTGYTGAVLLFILVVAHVMKPGKLREGLASLKDRSLLASAGVAVIVFILLNPHAFLRFRDFYQTFPLHSNVFTEGRPGGVAATGSSAGYYIFDAIPSSLGLVCTAFFAAAVILLLWRREKRELLFAAYPVVYLVTISGWEIRSESFLLPVLPVMIILASHGLIALCRWLSAALKKYVPAAGRLAGPAVLSLFSALTVIPMLTRDYAYGRSFDVPDTRTVARKWIMQSIPPGQVIATALPGMTLPADRFSAFTIPSQPAGQELFGGFYRTEWYEDLDLLITGSFEYDRYRLEPDKYGELVQFYDSLRLQYALIREFKPDSDQNGPTLWVYHPRPGRGEILSGELFDSVRQLSDTSMTVNFLKTLAYKMIFKGKLRKGEQLFRWALSLDTLDEKTLKDYSRVLSGLGRYGDALGILDRIVKNPPSIELLAFRGSLLRRVRRFQESEACLLQALTLNAHFLPAYVELDQLYEESNDIGKRIAILDRYQRESPPGNDESARIARVLRELRKEP